MVIQVKTLSRKQSLCLVAADKLTDEPRRSSQQKEEGERIEDRIVHAMLVTAHVKSSPNRLKGLSALKSARLHVHAQEQHALDLCYALCHRSMDLCKIEPFAEQVRLRDVSKAT